MKPHPMQELGRDIAKALWDDGVPFDGYLVYREQNRTVIRVLLTEIDGRAIQVCTTIPDDCPSIRPIVQALRFYAEGALS